MIDVILHTSELENNILMSSNRNIAKNTLFLYLRMALIMLVSLYTVRVILNELGVEDYGIYSAIGGIISTLSFVTSILTNASQRFFSIEIGQKKLTKLKKTFSSIVLIYISLGLVVVLFAETLGSWFIHNKMTIPEFRTDAANWVFQCTIISFFISIITAPYQAMIIAKEKLEIYAYVGILDAILKLSIALLIKEIHFDKLISYAILIVLSTFISQIIYIYYCVKKCPEAQFLFHSDKSTIKDVLSYSAWSLFGSLAYVCNSQGINLILNVFWGPVVNAAYAIGNQVKSSVNLFGSNFYVAVRPVMMKEYASGNIEYVKKLFFTSSKTLFLLLFIIIFPISFQLEGILNLWLGSVGPYMLSFTRLLLIYAILLSMSDPITSIVQAANEVKRYHLYVDGFTLMTLPIVYALFKYGLSADYAFYASITIFIIAHYIRLVILSQIINLHPLLYIKGVFIPIAISVLVTVFGAEIVESCSMNMEYSWIIKLFIDFLIALLAQVFILLTNAERKQIINLFKSFIYRIKSNL